MTSHLGEAEKARMERSGIVALSDEQGLALFDQALARSPSLALAVGLKREALRSQAQAGLLPPLLSALIRTPTRRRARDSSLATRLGGLSEQERAEVLLELVRSEVAAVLGQDSPTAIDPERAFKELGFDSLAAVELKNRLASASGVRLATTTVFDYPSSGALAEFLLAQISPEGTNGGGLGLREREVREVLASIPLEHLRSAGLLDPLLRLASPEREAQAETADESDLIDAMDVEELIRKSSGGVATETELA